MRRTGIDIIGDVPWGTHFCQFYETGQDLMDILVPYFKEGLHSGEFCMWVTSEPLKVDQATEALRKAVPDLDDYIAQGQIEILDYSQWYIRSGKFSADEVLKGWVDKLAEAQKRGYEGLRLTGNTFWLEKADWYDFTKYEETVNNVIGRYNMLAICTYSLQKCNAREILDVIANHQFALIKRSGQWEIIESERHRKTEQALRESEEKLRETTRRFQTIVDNAPVAIYVKNRDGRFVFGNRQLERYTGHPLERLLGMTDYDFAPKEDADRWRENDLKVLEGQREEFEEIGIDRDGRPYVNISMKFPLLDGSGKPAEVCGISTEITERKLQEEALQKSKEELEVSGGGVASAERRTPPHPAGSTGEGGAISHALRKQHIRDYPVRSQGWRKNPLSKPSGLPDVRLD